MMGTRRVARRTGVGSAGAGDEGGFARVDQIDTHRTQIE